MLLITGSSRYGVVAITFSLFVATICGGTSGVLLIRRPIGPDCCDIIGGWSATMIFLLVTLLLTGSCGCCCCCCNSGWVAESDLWCLLLWMAKKLFYLKPIVFPYITFDCPLCLCHNRRRHEWTSHCRPTSVPLFRLCSAFHDAPLAPIVLTDLWAVPSRRHRHHCNWCHQSISAIRVQFFEWVPNGGGDRESYF